MLTYRIQHKREPEGRECVNAFSLQNCRGTFYCSLYVDTLINNRNRYINHYKNNKERLTDTSDLMFVGVLFLFSFELLIDGFCKLC